MGTATDADQMRDAMSTGRACARAAWMKRASGRGIEQARRLAGQFSVAPPGRGMEAMRLWVYGWMGARRTVSAEPISTMRPRYMTAIRSAIRRATPRSCVTNSTAMPSLRRRSPSRLSTPAATDASSADVGSSQSRMRGGTMMARAIATRWRWPPESWNGRTPATHAGRPTSAKRRDRALVALPAIEAFAAQPLADDLADGQPRSQ